MATQSPEPIPVPLVDPVATAVNQLIDRLILSLEQRRVYLLTQLRDTREEMGANRVARQQMEKQIAETRAFLEGQMTHNKLHSMQERIVADLEGKREQLQTNAPPPQEVVFLCDTRDLEEHIARLGEIIKIEIPPKPVNRPIPPKPLIPNYAAFQQPIVAVGEVGSVPGKLIQPCGVSIEQETGHIYVADLSNNRIQIFSQTGEYLNHFGGPHLKWPWGILFHRDSIYITDVGHHAIFLFTLSDLTMKKRFGKKGSGNEDFTCPKQVAISPNQHLYVADQENHIIQILSTNLDFLGSLRHQNMRDPVDVKFKNKELYVLTLKESECIQVFSLTGEKIRSLVTRQGDGMQTIESLFFCLDKRNNIIISDLSTDDIKVFSPEGELLHTIGQEGHEAGKFSYPTGIAILKSNKLVCVSSNTSFSLQIFSA